MTNKLQETSPISENFGGEFIVIKRCHSCKELEADKRSFLTLNFNSFNVNHSDHINSLRKQFGAEPGFLANLFGILKPFNYFHGHVKYVTINDYLNHLINHDLINTNKKHFCEACSMDSQIDVVFKLHKVPNSLTIGINYKDSQEDLLRLKDFMSLDLSPFIQQKYVSTSENPFFEQDQLQAFNYVLVSMVYFQETGNYESGFTTLTRKKDHTWELRSKFRNEMVPKSEVESVEFPYLLVYERVLDVEPNRKQLLSRIAKDSPIQANQSLPIPDFWTDRLEYLQNPGQLSYTHYICKHLKLKPIYRDVFDEEYTTYALDDLEVSLTMDPGSPSKLGKNKLGSKSIKSPGKSPSKQAPENFYSVHKCNAGSRYLTADLTKEIVEKYCFDVDHETLKRVNFNEPCQECLSELRKRTMRRYKETKFVKSIIDKYPDYQGPYFLVNDQWAAEWNLYITYKEDNNSTLNRHLFDAFQPPGPIPNQEVLDRSNAPTNSEWAFVHGETMQFLHMIYKCDVFLGRKEKSIRSQEVAFKGNYLSKDQLKEIEDILELIRPDSEISLNEFKEICLLELEEELRRMEEESEEDEEGDEEEEEEFLEEEEEEEEQEAMDNQGRARKVFPARGSKRVAGDPAETQLSTEL